MKTTTLTRKEFIERSMKGEVFSRQGTEYYYDETETIPFRFGTSPLYGCWDNFDGETEFEIVEPEPVFERRWRYVDHDINHSIETSYYYPDRNPPRGEAWKKIEDDYIDVDMSQFEDKQC